MAVLFQMMERERDQRERLQFFSSKKTSPPSFLFLLHAGVQSPFIGGKGSGASLWLHGERGSAGRLTSGCDWQGATPSTFHHESVWGGGFGSHVVCRVQRGKKKNCLPLLHVQGKEKGEQCRSKRHCSALFFFNIKRHRFMKNEPFHLKVAPTSFFELVLNLSFVLLSPHNVILILRINSIASLQISVSAAIVGCVFHFDPWPLIFVI